MNHIVQTEYDVTSDKSLSREYTIAMMADLHYPTSINSEKLTSIANRIQKENPDFVLLCGDIVDEYTTNQERKEAFEILGTLSRKSKVIYVFGNHDTGKHSLHNEISKEVLKTLIENQGITVLEDENKVLNEEIQIIGRKDYSLHNRKEMNELNTDSKIYTIVLDHQPKDLRTCDKSSVDLHLSGHTHAGQIFPLYFVYELFHINELNYGLKTMDSMIAINTSGISGWGFPIRTDHQSEYVLIHLNSN